MSKYLGDFVEDFATLNFNFNTHKADGTPITVAGTPSLCVYKNSTTQSTAGITLSIDYDSVTGMHHVVIDLSSDAFYSIGADYSVQIAAGTVDSISVVGYEIATFSIANRYLTLQRIVDAILDEDVTVHDGIGTTGKYIIDTRDNTNALVQIFTGITSAAKWLRGLFRKDAMDATAKAEINSGGGTFNETTDSLEAIRDTAPLGSTMRGTDNALLASNYTAPPLASDIVTALNSSVVDGTLTYLQMQRLVMAILAGKVAVGSGTSTFKRADGTTTAVTVTHDSTGNRTVISIGTL